MIGEAVTVINRNYHDLLAAQVVAVEAGRVLLDMGWTNLWFDLKSGDAEKEDCFYLDVDDRERLAG